MNLDEANHVFVTGGASGIGRGIAEAFAAHGIAVTIADINQENLTAAMSGQNDRVRGIVLDVRDRDSWRRAKTNAEADFGPVDILINNAGIAPVGSDLADMDPEAFDRVVAINFIGMFNGISAFGRDMRNQRRGHIVNTSSLAGLVAQTPGTACYSSSKFAVVAMSEVLRKEMAPHGVGVSVLVPTLVETDLAANTLALGGKIRDASMTEIVSDLKPSDVAKMVLRSIEVNRLYIYTSDDCWDYIEERFQALRSDYSTMAQVS